MIKPSKDKKSNYLWDIFSSVKLTIILLIILAIASVFGTLIPQEEGAYDMYHSLWFRIIIGLLSLNLIVCSIERLPAKIRLYRTMPRPDRSKSFENLPLQRSFLAEGRIEDIAGRVTALLKGLYRNVVVKNTSEGNFFYGDKGRYTHFGVYLVHLSVLIILIGGIIGSLFGFEARVYILEGEQVNTVTLTKSKVPLKLGFEVRLDKFTVNFYENRTPKEFRSDLTFFVYGKEMKKRSLLVNHPIEFRGLTFYQSWYDIVPRKKVHLKISHNAGEHKTTNMEVEISHPIPLPGNEGVFQVVEVNKNLKGMMGPAALISIKPHQGKETHFWIFQNIEILQNRFPKAMLQSPILNPSTFKPYTFFLEKLESKFISGLQVNKDPGVSFVWLGCFMMIMGFFIVFFTSHRQIWVRVTKNEGEIRVSVAGRANKNPVGLDRELDKLTHKLRTRL